MLHFSGLEFEGSEPRHEPTYCSSSHVVAVPQIQNRGTLAQILAQGQSSSSKKRKIVNRCQLRANLPHIKRRRKTDVKNKLGLKFEADMTDLCASQSTVFLRVWEQTGVAGIEWAWLNRIVRRNGQTLSQDQIWYTIIMIS